jgi:hypothetical protein
MRLVLSIITITQSLLQDLPITWTYSPPKLVVSQVAKSRNDAVKSAEAIAITFTKYLPWSV